MITPQVIPLTNCVDISLIARLFAKFRGRYGQLWTSRATNDDDWEFIMDDWLEELSKFPVEHVRGAFNKTLSKYKEFPPTLGQVVDLCLQESGVPDIHAVVNLMVARDFSHPIVKMIYDKIGGWTLTNGKSEDIQRKTKEYYTDAVANFHIEPQKAWAQLESYNARPKELPAPDKIPTAGESKAFRECLNKCQEILQSKKIAGGGKTYKEFDANKIKRGHKDFDQKVFDEYREYLMGIPETETMILPPTYLLDRNKFLNLRDQADWLRKQGYIPTNQREGFAAPINSDKKTGGRPQPIYKNWAHD